MLLDNINGYRYAKYGWLRNNKISKKKKFKLQ